MLWLNNGQIYRRISMIIKSIASGSSGNCYIISDGKTQLMLDCGITLKQIQKGCDFSLHEISGCFLSHGH